MPHEERTTTSGGEWRVFAGLGLLIYLLFLAAAIVSFYSPGFYYFWDEWDALYRLSMSTTYDFVTSPHNEHFMPIHNCLYAALVSTIDQRYELSVLAQCGLLAVIGVVLFEVLWKVGVHWLIAFVVGAFYVAAPPHFEVVTWLWELGLLLSTLLTVGTFHYWLPERRGWNGVLFSGLLAVVAAFSFGSGLIIPVVLAGFALVDFGALPRNQRRPLRLWPVAFNLVLFSTVAGIYLFFRPPIMDRALAITERFGPDSLATAVKTLGSLLLYIPVIAIYGPLEWFVGSAWRPARTPAICISWTITFLVLITPVLWRSRWRLALLKLGLYQLTAFGLIAVLCFKRRLTYGAGFADRYQTFGLVPFVICVALFLQVAIEHRHLLVRLGGYLGLMWLVLVTADNVRSNYREKQDHANRRGRVVRQSFEQLRNYLVSRSERPAADLDLSHHAHPAMSLRRLQQAMQAFPSLAGVAAPSSYVPVRYVEQLVNDRTWAGGDKDACMRQSMRFSEDIFLQRIELLLTGNNRGAMADGRLRIVDAGGQVLYEVGIHGSSVMANLWFPVLLPNVAVHGGRSYAFELCCSECSQKRPFGVWMSTDAESYVDGETVTPDGVAGDICFRLAYTTDSID